jgi:hypothetical protein
MRSSLGFYLEIANPESPDLPEMAGQIDALLPHMPENVVILYEISIKTA